MEEAREEPRLWRPAFPFDIIERIIGSTQRLLKYLVHHQPLPSLVIRPAGKLTNQREQVLMNRALFFGWREESPLPSHLIKPLHRQLSKVHLQVNLSLGQHVDMLHDC